MYEGFLRYDGTELANAVRTATYARTLDLGFFKPHDACLGMAGFLPDFPYTTPAQDRPPWVDDTRRESMDFAGFWPLEISGVDTTTYQRPVTERLGDGGVLGLGRHNSRTIVMRGLLLGKTDESISAGASWLASVLERRACNYNLTAPNLRNCTGAGLDYLALCPGDCGCTQFVCDQTYLDEWFRHLYDVGLVEGPEVLQRRCVTGGAFAEIQFTLVATNPFRYGRTMDATTTAFSFTYQDVLDYFSPTYQQLWDTIAAFYGDNYSGMYQALFDCLHPLGTTRSITTVPAAPGVPSVTSLPPPIQDPACPPVPAFPYYPLNSIYCNDPWSGSWNRATYRIAAVDVAKWVEQVPIVSIYNLANDHDNIRIRFTPGNGDPDSDWIAEYFVTWLPATTTITFDAVADSVTTRAFGAFEDVDAEHLVVLSTKGQDNRWPVVSCGGHWLVTVDLPSTFSSFDDLAIQILLVTREP